jgi:hypothetical protein
LGHAKTRRREANHAVLRASREAARSGWYDALTIKGKLGWAGLGPQAGRDRHPGATVEKIGYSQPERLPAELSRRGDVQRLRRRVRIDGAGKRGRRAHPVAPITLRGTGHIAIEARDPGDDDFVAIGLEHAIAQATAERDGRDAEGGEQEFGSQPTPGRREQEARTPPLILRSGLRLPGTRWPTRCRPPAPGPRRTRARSHPKPVSAFRLPIPVHEAQNSRSGGQLGWFAV